MDVLVESLLGGFGWYVLCGIVLGLISVLQILGDPDAFRVVVGRNARVDDLALFFAISVLAWPVQVWEWSNGDGPWRG